MKGGLQWLSIACRDVLHVEGYVVLMILFVLKFCLCKFSDTICVLLQKEKIFYYFAVISGVCFR